MLVHVDDGDGVGGAVVGVLLADLFGHESPDAVLCVNASVCVLCMYGRKKPTRKTQSRTTYAHTMMNMHICNLKQ